MNSIRWHPTVSGSSLHSFYTRGSILFSRLFLAFGIQRHLTIWWRGGTIQILCCDCIWVRVLTYYSSSSPLVISKLNALLPGLRPLQGFLGFRHLPSTIPWKLLDIRQCYHHMVKFMANTLSNFWPQLVSSHHDFLNLTVNLQRCPIQIHIRVGGGTSTQETDAQSYSTPLEARIYRKSRSLGGSKPGTSGLVNAYEV